MSIKPALGWLALLLFTTTAQAEGGNALLKDGLVSPRAGLFAPVTPKTKAPHPTPAGAKTAAPALIVVASERPSADYEAEIYSGVPLDGDLAKERGLAKGLVFMVFERERRGTFRIAKEKIKKLVRIRLDEGLTVASLTTEKGASRAPRERWDVLDTQDGVAVVATRTTNAGIFTTSDVYAFPRGATLERRIAAVEALPAAAQGRIREVLLLAERRR